MIPQCSTCTISNRCCTRAAPPGTARHGRRASCLRACLTGIERNGCPGLLMCWRLRRPMPPPRAPSLPARTRLSQRHSRAADSRLKCGATSSCSPEIWSITRTARRSDFSAAQIWPRCAIASGIGLAAGRQEPRCCACIHRGRSAHRSRGRGRGRGARNWLGPRWHSTAAGRQRYATENPGSLGRRDSGGFDFARCRGLPVRDGEHLLLAEALSLRRCGVPGYWRAVTDANAWRPRAGCCWKRSLHGKRLGQLAF